MKDNKELLQRDSSISLRDVFWCVLLNWKKILIATLALALLLGLYKGFATYGQYKIQNQAFSGGTAVSASHTYEGNPAITVQPKGLSLFAGQQAVFSVSTAGSIKQFHWQFSRDGLSWTYLNVDTYPSASTDTLVFTALSTQNAYLFRCIVTFENETSIATYGAMLEVTASASSKRLTPGDALKNAFKFVVVGAVLGLAGSFLFCLLVFAGKGYFTNGLTLQKRYGIQGLGVFPSPAHKGISRKILNRMTYSNDASRKDLINLLAANINLRVKSSDVTALTGTVSEKRLRILQKTLQPLVKARLVPIGNINQQAEALNRLTRGRLVICAERILDSQLPYVDREMDTLVQTGAECIGFILME